MRKQKSVFNKKSAGFTLVELLVVIVIIGLLSSITLVVVTKVREKARIVANLQFSASIYYALGADIAGEWKFEDGSCGGSPYDGFCDSSGNNNHGQNMGGVSRSNNDEIPQLGQKAEFNGSSSYVEVPDNDILDIKNAITIEGWVKTNYTTATAWYFVSKFTYTLYVSTNNAQFLL